MQRLKPKMTQKVLDSGFQPDLLALQSRYPASTWIASSQISSWVSQSCPRTLTITGLWMEIHMPTQPSTMWLACAPKRIFYLKIKQLNKNQNNKHSMDFYWLPCRFIFFFVLIIASQLFGTFISMALSYKLPFPWEEPRILTLSFNLDIVVFSYLSL